MLDDFPQRLAAMLEAFATKVRSLTVDRAARVITFVTLGGVALVLVATAVIFFLIGLLRITDELVYRACDCSTSMEIAYATIGGLFLVAGVLLWSRRARAKSGNDS